MTDKRTIIEQIFSEKNHALCSKIIELLADETGMNIFAVLAFASTYAIVRADEEGLRRTEVRDMYVGLIDTFLKASGDANAERDQSTPSPILQ